MDQNFETRIKMVLIILLFVQVLFFGNVFVLSDSLWPHGATIVASVSRSLYTDQRAYKEGDTVVVMIVEAAQAQQSASIKTQKDGSASGGFGTNLNFPFTSSSGNGNYVGAALSESQNGSGSNLRSGNLKATVAVTITKILPNGNFEIKGSHMVTVNEEKENLEVSGIIRPGDIASNNTIPSSSIADARIVYEGNGPLGEKAKVGFLSRILDWLWFF